jgi:hypothetical protein
MGLDTKTYWLTDRQSQCDFDFEELVVVRSWKSSVDEEFIWELGRVMETAV